MQQPGPSKTLSTGRAPGIAYRELPELPGRPIFDCTRLHAAISTVACADMWRAANESRSERYTACRACFVGASHAGVDNASRSPIRGALVCGRCARGATRLIHGHLCVSCFNREREVMRGKNARGAAPVKAAKLAPRQITYLSNGRLRTTRLERTASPVELIVATLRDSVHTTFFAWRAPTAGLRQMRLF